MKNRVSRGSDKKDQKKWLKGGSARSRGRAGTERGTKPYETQKLRENQRKLPVLKGEGLWQ